MLIQRTSEDTQPPPLRSCAGNFPSGEFPEVLPDSSQGGDTVGKADPKFRFNFATIIPANTEYGRGQPAHQWILCWTNTYMR